MRNVITRTLAVLGVATAVAAATGAAAGAATSDGGHTAQVRGAAHLDWDGKHTGPWKSDLWIGVDNARATYPDAVSVVPSAASGTVRVKHRFWNTETHQEGTAWFNLDVDCVAVGGPVATITGIVNQQHSPDQAFLEGVRVGLTVYSGAGKQPGRVGALRAGTRDDQIPLCASTAPAWPVKKGGYRVWDR
ncbi:hypothetical protein GCM10009678_87930 [Actinomadura kijaniata]|uniref:Secreted protein n=1 Tax=Actinomadura namibiensis TaxID=182080 RepID=A0A7W3QKD8_ACTNM|nr:hypothetical protein [Actinomadura namibiensis]MBA8949858.1 hypothetical protein [Actinomadura namibiensis]